MSETTPLPMCPMAHACNRMMERRGSNLWMAIPGVVLIALGLAIIVFPQILLWLAAIALICMGLAMLVMVNFMAL